jgi:transcriptional regulator with XRE-family HTH domain
MEYAQNPSMPSKPRLLSATLGGRIEEAFRNAGMSRMAFARAVGASYPATYDWTGDKFAPRADTLQRIAAATGYSATELLGTGAARESGDISTTLAEFLETRAARDITDEEFARLREFQWPAQITPSADSYMFALYAIRAQLSPEDAKEAVRVSNDANARAAASGVKPPSPRSPKRRN